MSDSLTLADLVDGLTRHGDLFTRLDVFADDVRELATARSGQPGANLQPIDPDGGAYVFERDGDSFVLSVTGDGVARLRRAHGEALATSTGLVGSAVSTAIDAAKSKKGAGWARERVHAMLVGGPIGSPGPEPRPTQILPMRFDLDTRTWSAYDGGLVRWLKSEFLATG